ncbi:concanavalin A-like lectin/glucanase superfamily protein [Anseongella ginsenosidimutans]|uniref:Concanavalin A-like lectin/glucanase superfamily protein n=1 Tax=Anseongella ginsenosidimutans TaxID=496056 RepID=A0A4R3KSZ0_9SPHI|nr:LamG domain-containing protein [Anseongella ginsenosidimutans]QEC53371.1 LamG domain-containing protein [Anseongella ginsenosidimutans]TCS88254.1 concanavalin A-like lectin/glucanase superfamily protein [Anseongella ginsenosidimutans]
MISLKKRAMKALAAAALMVLAAGCDKKLEDDKPDFSSNLIHYFPFSGNGVDDVSGQEFDMHGITYLSDRKGTENSSAFFNGFSGWMDISVGLKEKAGTLSFWIYPCLCKENNPLFVKKSVESDPYFGKYYVGYSEEGRIEAMCNGKWNVETDIVIQANQWYNVVLRWDDASGIVDIFVNGKKKLSKEYTVDASALPDDATPAYLGKILHKPEEGGAVETVYYKGKLDDVRLYNIWLPYEEIEALYTE